MPGQTDLLETGGPLRADLRPLRLPDGEGIGDTRPDATLRLHGPLEVVEEAGVIRETFDRLGDKWSLLIVSILSNGPQRFTSLKYAAEGISQRMLTLTLRRLERDGLVRRTAFAEIPPRVEYELTSLGQTLVGPATALADWAVAHRSSMDSTQQDFDDRPPRRT